MYGAPTGQTEADRTAAELQSLMKEAPGLRFGVISFYADQVEAIGSALQDLGITERAGQDEDHFVGVGEFRVTPDGKERLRVGSVDSFQGQAVRRRPPLDDEVRAGLGRQSTR